MKDSIQELIDSYRSPVLFSDARKGTIMFTNEALQQKLGLSKNKIIGMHLDELLLYKQIIKQQPVWKHNNDHYLVQNEELTLSGFDYIKSVLKPFSDDDAMTNITFQKEMTARLVHRLRSPLNGTSGFAELLKETSLDENQERYIEAIEEGLNDLKSVLSQIEVLGQPVSVQKTMVDFEQLSEGVQASFSEQRQKRINVVIDEKRKKTDYLLLKAIIEELVLNAFQHGPDDESPINIYFGQDRIRVNNQGAPIPEELASKVFHPFFSAKARSMGIGLAKCSYFATHMDLELKLAENSVESGVSFDIIFPDSASA